MMDGADDGPRRDLIGYGHQPPRVEWPNGALIAVNLVVNYEEGSELSWAAGDAKSEARGEIDYPFPSTERNLATESMFEYGSRAGVWRLLRIFDEYRVPATFFACAMAFEANDQVARAVTAAGHDVCGHGWRWSEPWTMTRDEERLDIARTVASLKRTCGQAPAGWYWRWSPTVHTRELLVEHGGFLYDSDSYNDDLPYYASAAGRRHLVIPYTATYNDGQGTRSPSSFLDFARRGFDELRREGAAGTPKMMTIGMHPRRSGQAARSSALREFIEHALSRGDVWFARRSDIARWWIDHVKESPA